GSLSRAARAAARRSARGPADARRSRLHHANVRSRAAARRRSGFLRAHDDCAAPVVDSATAGRADDLADRRAPGRRRADAGHRRRADAQSLSSAHAASASRRVARRERACIITPKGSSISGMDSLANQAVSDDALIAEPSQRQTRAGKLAAYVDLTKPRITMLVTATAAAGYCLGSTGGIDYFRFFNTAMGIALLSSGLGTLNQYIERDLDRLMRRTEMRPLPTGKLQPRQALWFGVALSVVATVYLAVLVNPLSAALGVLTLAAYLFAYTPLKTRTTLSTIIGAFPGAMPPFIGWVAANGQITIEAWILFAILFLWQFPHFLAIA